MAELELVIGDKRRSSWSFRPWLAMKMGGIPFRETQVFFDLPGTRETIRHHTPAGKVPVLHDGPVSVWETTAIGEYLHERFPGAGLWPVDPYARALARSLANEMHAGFATLRRVCPFAIGEKRPTPPMTAELESDIARIEWLWADCRRRSTGFGGPFLFGRFGFVDAMYAPVVSRFLTYGIAARTAESTAYREAMVTLAPWREWLEDASRER